MFTRQIENSAQPYKLHTNPIHWSFAAADANTQNEQLGKINSAPDIHRPGPRQANNKPVSSNLRAPQWSLLHARAGLNLPFRRARGSFLPALATPPPHQVRVPPRAEHLIITCYKVRWAERGCECRAEVVWQYRVAIGPRGWHQCPGCRLVYFAARGRVVLWIEPLSSVKMGALVGDIFSRWPLECEG